MQTESQRVSTAADLPSIRRVDPFVSLQWLKTGWADFRRAGWPSFAHGLIVTIASLVIVYVASWYWPLLAGAVSGFVVIGPILATGLYTLSRRLDRGQPVRIGDAVKAWRRASRHLIGFGILLILAGTGWVLVSVLMFYFFVPVEISEPADFLRYVIIQDDRLFLLWTILGSMGAALVFGMTVVSVPLLVDREITLRNAITVSLRAVGENPFATACWAILIAVITGLSIASLMLGFLVLYPVLGHASWRAYRDMVDPGRLPPREHHD